jgi:hypothetical protein
VTGFDRSTGLFLTPTCSFTEVSLIELPHFSTVDESESPAIAVDSYVISGTFTSSGRNIVGYGFLYRTSVASTVTATLPEYTFVIANTSPSLEGAAAGASKLAKQVDPSTPTANDPFPDLAPIDCTPYANDCQRMCTCR